MKLGRKVSMIEVKRCFVVSDRAKPIHRSGKSRVTTQKKFLAQLKKVESAVRRMSEVQLDQIITRNKVRDAWTPIRNERLKAYNAMSWHLATVRTNEVGVWKGAGGLPATWTSGSLQETGKLVSKALKHGSRLLTKRAKAAIPGILRTSLGIIQKDSYLFPIILPPDTIPKARRGCAKVRGDIDDGCMRAIALAVAGKKSFKAYTGVKR